MSEILNRKKCIPCEGGLPLMSEGEISELAGHIPDWQIINVEQNGTEFKTLQKRFTFKNFREAMSFLREVEEVAEGEGHHPDFSVHYNKVDFTIWTHAIGGLHENDFIVASKIDKLLE